MQVTEQQIEKAAEALWRDFFEGIDLGPWPDKAVRANRWRRTARAVLATLPDAPALEPPGDLIADMQRAYIVAANMPQNNACATDSCCFAGMTAALRVALNRRQVLGDILFHRQGNDAIRLINEELASRRERLLQPQPKTLEEPREIVYREADASAFKPRVCGLCGSWVIDQLAHTAWHHNAQLKEDRHA